MRILLLFFFICLAISISAQIAIVDFEDNGLMPPKPDCLATAEWINDPNVPIVSLETNSVQCGINNTPNYVKYVETVGSNQGNSLQLAFSGATATTGYNLVTNQYVSFMVYSEDQTTFDILLELGTGATPHFSMSKTVTTTLNTWTEIEFDFSGNDPNATINNPNGWITNTRIHFNNGSVGSGDTYFVDELYTSPTTSVGPFAIPGTVGISTPEFMNYNVTGGLLKKLDLQLTTSGNYANFSIYANNIIIADNIDVPAAGTYTLSKLVEFPQSGNVQLKLEATGSDIAVQSLSFSNYSGVDYPTFINVTNSVGIVDQTSLKYGGPSIADLNNDGSYDLVLNNHNDSPSKLYWGSAGGTFTKQNPDLSLFDLMDLHGSAPGDYDNDGDLDLLMTIGGGNGTNPTPPILYRNDGGVLTQVQTSVGITAGARGRSPRWSDMDNDGDLDLMLINAAGSNGSNGEQHLFYENMGNGTFQIKNIPGIETDGTEKLLITDIDGDQIDDAIFLSPLTIWRGNGDFTFTDVSSSWLPSGLINNYGTTAAVDIDMDNDGDLDIYLAQGEYYFAVAENNSVDFYPATQLLDVRVSGSQGTLPFTFNAGGSITLSELDYVIRNSYMGGFPIFLGSAMQQHVLADVNSTLPITQAMASGWPTNRTQNGMYIGHVGNGVWQVELVKNTDIYWSIHFSLDGLCTFTPTGWTPNNRNQQDILLQNNGSSFSNVSTQWNIPTGGNHWGVTKGDFNNDCFEDLYVYRFGYLKNRIADYLLLNTGQGSFEVTTTHTAKSTGTSDHGDMGQAFDYDSDGNVDILNGDDEYGLWHLYHNTGDNNNNNYVIVDVGYAPISNVDAISAVVTVTTASGTYVKRVGSAGESHSQSVLNRVHFGLCQDNIITSAEIKWRNGETISFEDEDVNQVLKASPVLPVDLLDFSGYIKGWGVQLNWKTQEEINNDKFVIERSNNAIDFKKIGEVAGKGTSSIRNAYDFLDKNPFSGKNYYRLKQFDFDGNSEYSNIIGVNFRNEGLEIGDFYPNPTHVGLVKLDYLATSAKDLNIAVYNTNGNMINQHIMSVSEGNNQLNFDFSELVRGTYLVQLDNTNNIIYRKLIIE